MDRIAFEALRDASSKLIRGDIRLIQTRPTAPLWTAEGVRIENALGFDAKLNVTFNPRTGGKTFNVSVRGIGPICRLDIDGHLHPPAGRTHKHGLRTPGCPDRNLPHADPRPELTGASLEEAFVAFCAMASIRHEGRFLGPETT